MKDNLYFVVENGINTSYIDSLLMALFYTPSSIYYNMLECDLNKDSFMYLQEIIKHKFIDVVRKGKTITSENINSIRNYLYYNTGWLDNNFDELLKQQNICEFYDFILNNLTNMQIEVMQTNIIKIPYITLNIPDTHEEVSVKTLMSQWLKNDTSCTRRVINIPQIVPLYINRFLSDKKVMTLLDIKEKIRLFDESDDMGKIKWNIHSVICHVGETIKDGHYYTLMANANKWLLFDNMSVPSLSEVDMSNSDLIKKIQSEAIFIIYKYEI